MKTSIRKSKELVLRREPTAKLEKDLDGRSHYVVTDHGVVLSPLCTGEGPAWRWAALMILVAESGYDWLLHNEDEVDVEEVVR